MTPILMSHPEKEKEDKEMREKERDRDNALLPNMCTFN